MVRRGTGRGENPHPQKPRVGHPAQGKPALQSMVRICQTKGYGTARNRPRRKPHPQRPRVGHPAQGKPALQSMVRICQTKGYGTARNRAEEKTPPSKTEGGAPSSGETCPTEHGENLHGLRTRRAEATRLQE